MTLASVPRAGRPEISVVLPCLDEEDAVGAVVDEAFAGIAATGRAGEVIVVDNGSTDRSAEIAAEHGAVVIREDRRGYGSAYLAGLAAAQGAYVVLADADGTYDLTKLEALVAPLRDGKDLVLGSRLHGAIEAHAMPWSHRWIGNPILTGTLNLLSRAGVSDAHCGLRAVRRDALERLDLSTTGMEFASEMVMKAARRGLAIGEVPIAYRRRLGSSKLLRYRDAYRHVRFMRLHSPTALFLVPGLLLFLVSFAALVALAPGPLEVLGRTWQIHAAVVAALGTLVGAQIVQVGLFARTYAVLYLGDRDPVLERVWPNVRLETGLLISTVVLLTGVGVLASVIGYWVANDFGALEKQHLSVLALTLIGLGVQGLAGSFFLSILGLRRPRER